MKSQHQQRVERFLIGAGHTIPLKPEVPSLEIRALQAALILEEARELIHALGFTEANGMLLSTHEPDLQAIAKEATDCEIVATGTLSVCGVHDEPILAEIDGHNITGLAGGTAREDGKWQRPVQHPAPAIWRTLCQQDLDGWRMFEVLYDSHLQDLLAERFVEIHRDDIWGAGRQAFRDGLTPAEAAALFFKHVLAEDLEKTNESTSVGASVAE